MSVNPRSRPGPARLGPGRARQAETRAASKAPPKLRGEVPPSFDAAWYRRTYADVDAIGLEPQDHYARFGTLLGRPPCAAPNRLARIVLVVVDLTTIGGISSRTRRLLAHRHERPVPYMALSSRADSGAAIDGVLCHALDPAGVEEEIARWSPMDTVLVLSNNALRSFPSALRDRLFGFPIIYISAGQMAFMVQDSDILGMPEYLERLRAMHILSFSRADINFQRQLGIHGQTLGFVPVEQRAKNTFAPSRNRLIGYVGRIDFHAKDCIRLLDVARSLRGSAWKRLTVFTTDGRNSPGYKTFRTLVQRLHLEDAVQFVVNTTDKDQIFGRMAAMVLPSRKESFGNAVVEAMSYGVPVIAASYAPGPSEIIEDGVSGFLLDDFTGAAVMARLAELNPRRLERMSAAAFERHKHYRVEDHMDQLEQLAADAVARFDGTNRLAVFPRLKILEKIQ